MAGLCLKRHMRIVYDRLGEMRVCVCVYAHMHLLYRLNYAAVSQSTIQPVSQADGWVHMKQQGSEQNEPQWQRKQTTVRPQPQSTLPFTWLNMAVCREEGEEDRVEKKQREKEGERECRMMKGRRAGEMVGVKTEEGKVKKEGDKQDRKQKRTRGNKLARGMKCF